MKTTYLWFAQMLTFHLTYIVILLSIFHWQNSILSADFFSGKFDILFKNNMNLNTERHSPVASFWSKLLMQKMILQRKQTTVF